MIQNNTIQVFLWCEELGVHEVSLYWSKYNACSWIAGFLYISIIMRAFQIVLQVWLVRSQMLINTIFGYKEILRFLGLLLVGLLFILFIELLSFGTNLVRILRIMVILTSLNLIYIWSCSVGMLSKQINYIFSGLFFCIFHYVILGFYIVMLCCLFLCWFW